MPGMVHATPWLQQRRSMLITLPTYLLDWSEASCQHPTAKRLQRKLQPNSTPCRQRLSAWPLPSCKPTHTTDNDCLLVTTDAASKAGTVAIELDAVPFTARQHAPGTVSTGPCRITHSAGRVSSASIFVCCPSLAFAAGAAAGSGRFLWCAGHCLLERSTPVMGPHISCRADRVAGSISLGVCQTSSIGRVQFRCSRNTCGGNAHSNH